jgi:hypothetical protein
MHPTRNREMVWPNLLEERCPRCALKLATDGSVFRCNGSCGFEISAGRMFELKNKMPMPNVENVTGKRKTLPNGKVVFQSAKIFKGKKPPQPYQLGF